MTVDLGDVWLPQAPPPEISAAQLDGFGQSFTHGPSGLQLSGRMLPPQGDGSLRDLLRFFDQYRELSWPSASVHIEHGTRRALCFVVGTFSDAMPDQVVREWFVSNGREVANFAGFADEATWKLALPACHRLALSVTFTVLEKSIVP